MDAKVVICETIINYVFQDKLLCLEALQTSGHMLRWHHDIIHVNKNDRLAVLGDTAAKTNLCRLWFVTGRSKGSYVRSSHCTLLTCCQANGPKLSKHFWEILICVLSASHTA
jgi:hypothetical protein